MRVFLWTGRESKGRKRVQQEQQPWHPKREWFRKVVTFAFGDFKYSFLALIQLLSWKLVKFPADPEWKNKNFGSILSERYQDIAGTDQETEKRRDDIGRDLRVSSLANGTPNVVPMLGQNSPDREITTWSLPHSLLFTTHPRKKWSYLHEEHIYWTQINASAPAYVFLSGAVQS